MEIKRYHTLPDALAKEIIDLFYQTFLESEGAEEAKLIEKLVRELIIDTDPALRDVVVALEADRVIGCIIFTPLYPENEAYSARLLSPVAVHTQFQKRGIGQQLIAFGKKFLQEENVAVVCMYGDIRYYSKSGFSSVHINKIPAPYTLSMPEGWLALFLKPDKTVPTVAEMGCVPAFQKPEIW
jgi:putative acetyltransferase